MNKPDNIHPVNTDEQLPEFKTHNGDEYELCLAYQEPVFFGTKTGRYYEIAEKALNHPEVEQAAEKSLDGLHVQRDATGNNYNVYVYLTPKYKTFWNLLYQPSVYDSSIIIPIIRRSMPLMLAKEIIGVQPMTNPFGKTDDTDDE